MIQTEQITNEAYHADTTRISKSGLDQIEKSPAHYYSKYLDPNREERKETPALMIGKALHTAILEPDVFSSEYATIDDRQKIEEIGGGNPRLTKAYKEWKSEQTALIGNKTIIPIDDFLYCQFMQSHVRTNKTAASLLSNGYAEQSYFFEEPNTGAPCKIRPDWINPSIDVVVDIKTTEDASASAFRRGVEKYRYHVQDAFYSDGIYNSIGLPVQAFIFIAIEKTAPFNIGIYTIQNEGFQKGQDLYLRGCEKYMQCRESGIWAGLPDEIVELKLSEWALRD